MQQVVAHPVPYLSFLRHRKLRRKEGDVHTSYEIPSERGRLDKSVAQKLHVMDSCRKCMCVMLLLGMYLREEKGI